MVSFFQKRYTTTANIASGKVSVERFISEEDEYASGAFDRINITNEDSVVLEVWLNGNQDRSIRVPPNSEKTGSELKFTTMVVYSPSGAHTAGKISMIVENTKFPRRRP